LSVDGAAADIGFGAAAGCTTLTFGLAGAAACGVCAPSL